MGGVFVRIIDVADRGIFANFQSRKSVGAGRVGGRGGGGGLAWGGGGGAIMFICAALGLPLEY